MPTVIRVPNATPDLSTNHSAPGIDHPKGDPRVTVDHPSGDPEATDDHNASIPPIDVHSPRAQRIGDYQLQDRLGEGGMGMVHKAIDRKPKRGVAIKLIKYGIHASKSELDQLIVEAADEIVSLPVPQSVAPTG